MKKSLLAFSLLATQALYGQQLIHDGGGSYDLPAAACLSPEEYTRIKDMLRNNMAMLVEEGKLPAEHATAYIGNAGAALKPTTGNFIWPLQQQAGFDYNSYYGISNFVDHNALFPAQVLDWNCGSRTYDLASGYNHAGVDIFLWPFPQQMQQEGRVAVIAATDGIIIAKEDGHPDKNCAMGNAQWNAVYVGNSDGTICWYGHMKTGSLTSKQVGQPVAAGEYLGLVGSSGSSTGPHLHFETHDNNGNVIDPYAGACSPAQQSLWAGQKPYEEPTVNAVLSHNHTPLFPNCPELETVHDAVNFRPGDSLFLASYYHDQNTAAPSLHTVFRPDNSVFTTWSFVSPQYYSASYWYRLYMVDSSMPKGAWRYEVAYGGDTVTRHFNIEAQQSAAGVHDINQNVVLFPNPGKEGFYIKGMAARAGKMNIFSIMDLSGKMVLEHREQISGDTCFIAHTLEAGVYFLRVTNEQQMPLLLKFTVR